MSEERQDRPEPAPTGRSRYEDFDVEMPQPIAAPRGRTPTLVVASVVLAFAGLLPLLFVLAFRPTGSIGIGLVILGVAELVTAVLIVLLQPIGRALGYVLGAIGLVIGLITARESPADGLVTMGLNAYVIYAMAVSGPSFRRG
jgi:hypothetical protein